MVKIVILLKFMLRNSLDLFTSFLIQEYGTIKNSYY